MDTILIIDDDDQLRKSFNRLLTEEGYRVIEAASGETGCAAVKQSVPDLVILDIRLPGMSGLEAFKIIHEHEPKLPVIIMTAYGTTETAIEATKMGAFDYVLKPFDVPEMLTVIQQALETGRFIRSPVELNATPAKASRGAIIGRSKPMQAVYKEIGRVAPTDVTVLIRGESGTGKELVARAIYQHSLKADKPFQVINCVAIPETLMESELFGFEKGAFTGASHRRIGKLEQARGGTVFFDEIGDMPLSLQSKMLRVLQERSIERLGGHETIPVDVRIIAATNRDLEKAIANGTFREDLYYRLKVVTIWLPPLNQRGEDIELLTEYFLATYAAETGIAVPAISPEAMAHLKQCPWPGNVRELANTLHKAMIFNRGVPLDINDIRHADSGKACDEIDAEKECRKALKRMVRQHFLTQSDEKLYEICMERVSRILISEALQLTEGNRTHAARLLGLSRPNLHSKIEKLGLSLKTSVTGKPAVKNV